VLVAPGLSLAYQKGFDGIHQDLGVEGLDDVTVGAHIPGVSLVKLVTEGRDHNYRNPLGLRGGLYDMAGTDPVQFGHHEVHQDDVGGFGRSDIHGLFTIVGFEYIILLAQDVFYQQPDQTPEAIA